MLGRDIFAYTLAAIKRRKVRKGLAILGVAIGIAAIISLISLSQGFKNVVTVQFETGFASDTLIVTTGSLDFLDTESDFELFVNDTEIIDQIDNVSLSAAIIQRTCYIKLGGEEFLLNLIGVDFAKYATLFSNTFIAESGAIPSEPSNETVVIGTRVNDPWKNGTLLSDIQDSINITWTKRSGFEVENKTYTGTITAILNEIGGTSIGGPVDIGVYIPISQAQDFFETDECNTILVKLENSDEETIASTSKSIEDAYGGQIQVVTQKAILNAISDIVSTIELFLLAISAISLLVAGVGIMNIMLTSLMERTREIGILKSLGMKKRTVLAIFLTESFMIGLLGALAGIVSGWVLAISIDRLGLLRELASGTQETFIGEISISPVVYPELLIGALIFGLTISVIFGLYPAWRAAKLNPVEALRRE